MTSIIYTPKDIYEQDFKTSMRGYDKREVDEFLDDVIKDYETYIKEIQKLKDEIAELKANEKPSSKIAYGNPITPNSKPNFANVGSVSTAQVGSNNIEQSSQSQDYIAPVSTATNLDILKRISRLEKEVFGKQIVE